jgi:hypothetical protein
MSDVATLVLTLGFVVVGVVLAASVIMDASQPMGKHRHVTSPEDDRRGR